MVPSWEVKRSTWPQGVHPQLETNEVSDAEDDVVIPTVMFLKSSKQIQSAVDQRLQELSRIND